jgi:pimeloyl-ACP methyl ester carboxylesterase
MGEGEPVVAFEAGIGASSLNWRRIQERAARFTRACTYDRAGLGWSDKAGPKTFAASIDAFEGLVTSIGGPPCVLVGHSYGAWLALGCALASRIRVGGLVLIDPPSPWEWRTPAVGRARMLQRGRAACVLGAALAAVGFVRACLWLLERGRTRGPALALSAFGREASAVVGRLVGEVAKMPVEIRPAARAHWSRPSSFSALAAYLGQLPSAAVDLLNAIDAAVSQRGRAPLGDAPIVVIVRADAPQADLDAAARIAALSGRGELRQATAGGHWIHLDEPDLVVQVIEAVVEKVRRRLRASD